MEEKQKQGGDSRISQEKKLKNRDTYLLLYKELGQNRNEQK